MPCGSWPTGPGSRSTRTEAGPDRKTRAQLLEAMERAVEYYHERLLASPDAGRGPDYLRSRGYDGEVVRMFRLGWAPDDWDRSGQGS